MRQSTTICGKYGKTREETVNSSGITRARNSSFFMSDNQAVLLACGNSSKLRDIKEACYDKDSKENSLNNRSFRFTHHYFNFCS